MSVIMRTTTYIYKFSMEHTSRLLLPLLLLQLVYMENPCSSDSYELGHDSLHVPGASTFTLQIQRAYLLNYTCLDMIRLAAMLVGPYHIDSNTIRIPG